MRTTIANRFSESLTSIQRHARQLADEQVRLSGGTRLLRASDSPLTMGKAVDLRTTEAQLDALARLQSAASNRMAETESALRDAGKVLDDFHQLYAMTQNASIGPKQLEGLSSQAVVLQEELKQILSRADATGYRIFNQRLKGHRRWRHRWRCACLHKHYRKALRVFYAKPECKRG